MLWRGNDTDSQKLLWSCENQSFSVIPCASFDLVLSHDPGRVELATSWVGRFLTQPRCWWRGDDGKIQIDTEIIIQSFWKANYDFCECAMWRREERWPLDRALLASPVWAGELFAALLSSRGKWNVSQLNPSAVSAESKTVWQAKDVWKGDEEGQRGCTQKNDSFTSFYFRAFIPSFIHATLFTFLGIKCLRCSCISVKWTAHYVDTASAEYVEHDALITLILLQTPMVWWSLLIHLLHLSLSNLSSSMP